MQSRFKTIFFISLAFIVGCKREKGCTDQYASNYSIEADKDDGSCTYVRYLRVTEVEFTYDSTVISNANTSIWLNEQGTSTVGNSDTIYGNTSGIHSYYFGSSGYIIPILNGTVPQAHTLLVRLQDFNAQGIPVQAIGQSNISLLEYMPGEDNGPVPITEKTPFPDSLSTLNGTISVSDSFGANLSLTIHFEWLENL